MEISNLVASKFFSKKFPSPLVAPHLTPIERDFTDGREELQAAAQFEAARV